MFLFHRDSTALLPHHNAGLDSTCKLCRLCEGIYGYALPRNPRQTDKMQPAAAATAAVNQMISLQVSSVLIARPVRQPHKQDRIKKQFSSCVLACGTFLLRRLLSFCSKDIFPPSLALCSLSDHLTPPSTEQVLFAQVVRLYHCRSAQPHICSQAIQVSNTNMGFSAETARGSRQLPRGRPRLCCRVQSHQIECAEAGGHKAKHTVVQQTFQTCERNSELSLHLAGSSSKQSSTGEDDQQGSSGLWGGLRVDKDDVITIVGALAISYFIRT